MLVMSDLSYEERLKKFERIYYKLREALLLETWVPSGGYSDLHCITCYGSNPNALHELQDILTEENIQASKFLDTQIGGIFRTGPRKSLRLKYGTECFNVKKVLVGFREILLPDKSREWLEEWVKERKRERYRESNQVSVEQID